MESLLKYNMYPSLPANMLLVNSPSLIFYYQQQEILIHHIDYNNYSLKIILAALDKDTPQDQNLKTLSMTFFR